MKGVSMKISSFCLWRWQFMRLRNRIANSYVEDQREPPTSCSSASSCALRNLVLKFKSQWKHNFRSQNRTLHYSYDLHSYSLNFDDGFLH